MANELYIYTTPADSEVALTLDTGQVIDGQPTVANGRQDAHLMQIPAGTPGQGTVLSVEREGYRGISHRGLLVPSETAEAKFQLDDVHLELAETEPEPGPAPGPNPDVNPADIIASIYATGQYQLVTKSGCGKFTEACCTALHEQQSQMWGHIKKEPGQNQWNSHAVDAIQLMTPAGSTIPGIYDIIHDSESPNASPVFNYKSPPDPNLWYYPAAPFGEAMTALYDVTAEMQRAAHKALPKLPGLVERLADIVRQLR